MAQKRTTITKDIGGTQYFLNSTLRVPVGRSGQVWYHWLCLAFGYTTASRNLSKCEFKLTIKERTLVGEVNTVLFKMGLCLYMITD